MTIIDLNADLGEGFGVYTLGNDEEIIPLISSANIACGFHAGDPLIMKNTVEHALENDTAVGAHIAYPDLWGFGRRHISMDEDALYSFLLYQLGSLHAFLRANGAKMRHVKPHGVLYTEAASDEMLSEIICEVIMDFDKTLTIFAPAGSVTANTARIKGLPVANEGFADRAYNPDGTLVSRNEPGAVLHDPDLIARRALKMTENRIPVGEDDHLEMKVDTICLHGDTPSALTIARKVKEYLQDARVNIRPVGDCDER